MQITKIHYSKTIESNILGAGVWVKIGVEGEVSETESVSSAIEQARATVEDAHQKNAALQPSPNGGDLYFNVSKNKHEQ